MKEKNEMRANLPVLEKLLLVQAFVVDRINMNIDRINSVFLPGGPKEPIPRPQFVCLVSWFKWIFVCWAPIDLPIMESTDLKI